MELVVAQVANLTPHPLSDAIFGQLAADRFEDLKKDIEERDVQYPLVVDRFNRVICGSQRLRALKALGRTAIEVNIRMDLETEEDIREYLIKDNLYRRHLTPRQEYSAAKELERIYQVRSEHGHGRIGDKVAQDMGTNRDRITKLKRVFSSGEVDLIDKVDKGQLSLSAAAEEISARKKIVANKLPSDDRRATILKAIRFGREVDKFQAFLQRHPLPGFGSHKEQVAARIETLQAQLTQYLS